jgi:NadR type nicotinamide-nucleotide adenylyltransferase
MEKQLEQSRTCIIKIVLYGPESTGKTSLAKALAAHYETEWVPEFSRDYLQEKWDREQLICSREDILPISAGQMQMENILLERANKVLICDTNLLETAVYSKAYFNGFCEPLLLKQALKAHYDMYFLTYIDVPWVEDDLRDRPDQREHMFDKFKESLDLYEKPYEILRGDFKKRFEHAVKTIDKLIKDRKVGL